MRSHQRTRRANLPPGQVKRGSKLNPSFVDEEAWAHDVMSHVMCNSESFTTAWYLYMCDADTSTTPAPATVQHPLTLFDTVNLARESAREKYYKLCPIRPNVIGHSSKHARHRKTSRNVAWAACAGIPRGPRTRYPKRSCRHQHPDRQTPDTTDLIYYDPPEYDLPLCVVARAVPCDSVGLVAVLRAALAFAIVLSADTDHPLLAGLMLSVWLRVPFPY